MEIVDAFEVTVQRVGNVASGYAVRMAVVVLSALACRKDRRAWISFMGCGIVWSIVELSIAVLGNRVGLMTLNGRMRYAGAIVRGFSEGAAVAGCALVPYSYYTMAAAAIILFDAAVVYEGAMFVSKRVVISSTSNAYMGTLLISALWIFWRPTKGSYPAGAMWLMTAFGFTWNAFAMMSGARVVTPSNYTLAFALYDALFEIGLLYAALSQITLYLVEVVLGYDEEEPVKGVGVGALGDVVKSAASNEKLLDAQLMDEATPWAKLNVNNAGKPTAIVPRQPLAPVLLNLAVSPWAPNGQPRSRASSDENFRRSHRSLSEEEKGGENSYYAQHPPTPSSPTTFKDWQMRMVK